MTSSLPVPHARDWTGTMRESDRAYYERRLAEELAEAERCESGDVRTVHRRLADMYRARIELLSEMPPVKE